MADCTVWVLDWIWKLERHVRFVCEPAWTPEKRRRRRTVALPSPWGWFLMFPLPLFHPLWQAQAPYDKILRTKQNETTTKRHKVPLLKSPACWSPSRRGHRSQRATWRTVERLGCVLDTREIQAGRCTISPLKLSQGPRLSSVGQTRSAGMRLIANSQVWPPSQWGCCTQ